MPTVNINDFETKLKVILRPEHEPEFRQLMQEMRRQLNQSAASASDIAGGINDAAKASRTFVSQLKDISKALGSIEMVGREVRGIAINLGDVSDMVSGTLRQSSQEWVRAMGKVDTSARSTAEAMRRVEIANLRTGQIATQALLPSMQASARAAETWANVAQRHPWLIGLAVGTGNVLAQTADVLKNIGGIGQGIGQILALPEAVIKAGTSLKEKVLEPLREMFKSAARKQELAAEAAAAKTNLTAAHRMSDAARVHLQAASINKAAADRQSMTALSGGQAGGLAGAGGRLMGAITPATLAGGVLLGLTASSVLSRLRENEGGAGRAVRRAEDIANRAVGAVTGGAAGFQFTDPAKFFGQLQFIATQKFAEAGIYSWAPGLTDTMKVLSLDIAELTGAVDAATAAQLSAAMAGRAAPSALEISPQRQQAVEEYISFSRQMFEAETQYQKQRATTIKANQEQELLEISRFNRDQVRAEREMRRDQARAMVDFLRGQSKAMADLYRGFAREDRDLAHRRFIEDRNFARQEAEYEDQYLQQRLEAIAEGGEAMVDAEREFQKQQLRAREDYYYRLEDLIDQRDILGIVRAKREYERDRRRREEDFRDQQLAASEAANERLREIEAGYAAEREKRLADFELRRRDEDEERQYERNMRILDFKEEQARAKQEFEEDQARRSNEFREQQNEARKQFEEQINLQRTQNQKQLDLMDKQHAEERARREKEFNERLIQLDASLLEQAETQAKYYEIMQGELEKWLKSNTALLAQGNTLNAPGYQAPQFIRPGETPAVGASSVLIPAAPGYSEGVMLGQASRRSAASSRAGSRQTGGYVGLGRYDLGEGGYEYVLSHRTTRALEMMMGERLTQTALLRRIGAASGGISVGDIYAYGNNPMEAARMAGAMVEERIISAFENLA